MLDGALAGFWRRIHPLGEENDEFQTAIGSVKVFFDDLLPPRQSVAPRTQLDYRRCADGAACEHRKEKGPKPCF
jgi:hypothetical protein